MNLWEQKFKQENILVSFKEDSNSMIYSFKDGDNISYNNLVTLVSKDILEVLTNEFTEEKYIVSSLRWILRGLKIELSIRKVKTDIEIEHNKVGRK